MKLWHLVILAGLLGSNVAAKPRSPVATSSAEAQDAKVCQGICSLHQRPVTLISHARCLP